jgi:hypothetical protein
MNSDCLGGLDLLDLAIRRAGECRQIVEKDLSNISAEDMTLVRSKLLEIIVRIQAAEDLIEEMCEQIRALPTPALTSDPTVNGGSDEDA